jgi:hypothetical protein
MASEAQEGAKLRALRELDEIIHNKSKCPPNVNCAGLTITLGITVGLYVALYAINEGLGTAGSHGCNGDICLSVMRLIERDMKRIDGLLATAKGLIVEGRISNEAIDLITNEATQVITEVVNYYPVVIDLLVRYGRGRGQGV